MKQKIQVIILVILSLLVLSCVPAAQPTPNISFECQHAWSIYEQECILLECHRGAIDSRYGFATKEACEEFLISGQV